MSVNCGLIVNGENSQGIEDFRQRNLKRFKKEVKHGQHDLVVPVQSWAAAIRGDTQPSVQTMQLQGSVFNRPVNPAVIYQVIRWQRAMRRKVCRTVCWRMCNVTATLTSTPQM